MALHGTLLVQCGLLTLLLTPCSAHSGAHQLDSPAFWAHVVLASLVVWLFLPVSTSLVSFRLSLWHKRTMALASLLLSLLVLVGRFGVGAKSKTHPTWVWTAFSLWAVQAVFGFSREAIPGAKPFMNILVHRYLGIAVMVAIVGAWITGVEHRFGQCSNVTILTPVIINYYVLFFVKMVAKFDGVVVATGITNLLCGGVLMYMTFALECESAVILPVIVGYAYFFVIKGFFVLLPNYTWYEMTCLRSRFATYLALTFFEVVLVIGLFAVIVGTGQSLSVNFILRFSIVLIIQLVNLPTYYKKDDTRLPMCAFCDMAMTVFLGTMLQVKLAITTTMGIAALVAFVVAHGARAHKLKHENDNMEEDPGKFLDARFRVDGLFRACLTTPPRAAEDDNQTTEVGDELPTGPGMSGDVEMAPEHQVTVI